MGVLIVRLGENQYVKWSTTVGAPVSPLMTREEVGRELESQDGFVASAVAELLSAADTTGTSDPDVVLDDVLAENRAGADERHLSVAEIVRQYGGSD